MALEHLSSVSVQPLHWLGATYVFAVAEIEGNARAFAVGPDGVSRDPAEVLVANARARYDQLGKLAPDLLDSLTGVSDDALVDVSVMVAGDFIEPQIPDFGTDGHVPLAEFESWLMLHRAAQRERIIAAKAPVLAMIADAGGEPLRDDSELPFFEARVPAGLLRADATHRAPNVAQIDAADTPQGELLGYAAQGSWNDNLMVNAVGVPHDGSDVQVGLWEGTDRTAIALNNSRFAGVTVTYEPMMSPNPKPCPCAVTTPPNEVCVNNVCVGKHISWVAASVGMVGSYTYTDDNAPGVTFPITPPASGGSGAWNVHYTVGSGTTSGINYILTHPVVFLNHSQAAGGGANDNKVNWAAKYQALIFTQAAGNAENEVVTCGAQWNSLCVGGYSYESWNQPSTHHRWLGTVDASGVLAGSSYRNDLGHPLQDFPADVERPHLLGPASHSTLDGMHMPNVAAIGSGAMVPSDGSIVISGSSFASPAVLSTAIKVLGDEGFFSAAFHPATVKAILMAGSRDSEADGPIGNTSIWNSTADFEDGAGHPDYSFVKQITGNNRYLLRSLGNANFVSCGTNCREYTVATVAIPANKSLKVAMAYLSCTPSGWVPTEDPFDPGPPVALLNNDLDLSVTRSFFCGGSPFPISSADVFSEVEMVHFACSSGGSNIIRIRIKNGAVFNGCGSSTVQPVAVAWSFQ